MPIRIRLARHGRTHSPFYRLVCAHSRSPRSGKFLELLGTYNPIATRIKYGPSTYLPATIKTTEAVDGGEPVETVVLGAEVKGEILSGGVKELRLNVPRIKYWLSVGAQGTEPVLKLLGRFGILPRPPQRISYVTSVKKSERMTGRKGKRTFSTDAMSSTCVVDGEEEVVNVDRLMKAIRLGVAPWTV